MPDNVIRVGDVEILALSDGSLEFDLCNFFPTIPEDEWQPYGAHLTEAHKVRFNLGSYLIRADGRTILVDTGLGPRPKDTPDVPWGELLRDRSEEHTSELQSHHDLVCRLLLEKKKKPA